MRKITISIIGASGYAGGELLRILLFHKYVSISQVTSQKFIGLEVGEIHPNLRKVTNLTFSSQSDIKKCDLLFVSLPNAISMEYMKDFKTRATRIIDLGADFRLRNWEVFQDWYHIVHKAPHMVSDFIYGIAELHRKDIKKARFVACAGCEATVSILTLYPLVKHHLIENDIIIDAKMSSSQGGNNPSLSSHHPERHGVVRTYKPTDHRHTAEIEQELSPFMKNLHIAITATTIEMVRGLLVTIHTKPVKGVTEKDIWKAYRTEYQDEPFIRIVKKTTGNYRYPEPKILIGTNYCDIGFALSERERRLVIIGAIDNLGKGTSGQAVQAMNLMFGLPESTGLEFPGLHPI